MSQDIQKNELHYYVGLLQMKDNTNPRNRKTEFTNYALHNVIRTMRYSRHDMICGEDFSCLDFGSISLNGIVWNLNGVTPSSFKGCSFSDSSFISGHSMSVSLATWSENDKYIATMGYDKAIVIWSVQTGLVKKSFISNRWRFLGTSIIHDYWVITAANDNTVIVHGIDNDEEYCFHHSSKVDQIALSKDGRYCISCCLDGTIYIWDLNRKELVKEPFQAHADRVYSIAIDSKCRYLCTASADCTAKIWSESADRYTLLKHEDVVFKVKISPKDDFCCTTTVSTIDGVYIWYLRTGELKGIIAKEGASDFEISADGQLIVTASEYTNKIRIWDTQSLDLIYESDQNCGSEPIIAMTNDIKKPICIVRSNENIVAVDITNRKTLYVVERQELCKKNGIFLEISNDNTKFIVESDDRDTDSKIYAVLTGTPLTTLKSNSSFITPIAKCQSEISIACMHEEWMLTVDLDKHSINSNISYSDALIVNDIVYKLMKVPNLYSFENFIYTFSTNSNGNIYSIALKKNLPAVICRFDYANQKFVPLFPLNNHSERILSFAVSNDETKCVICSSSGSIMIYNNDGSFYSSLFEADENARITRDKVLISDNNERCLTKACLAGAVELWDMKNNRLIDVYEDKLAFDFFDNGTRFLLCDEFGFISIGDSETGDILKTIPTQITTNGRIALLYPYCISIEDCGQMEVWKCNLRNNDEDSVEHIDSFKIIKDLHIKGCDFTGVRASYNAINTLVQYGGIVDESWLNYEYGIDEESFWEE